MSCWESHEVVVDQLLQIVPNAEVRGLKTKILKAHLWIYCSVKNSEVSQTERLIYLSLQLGAFH